MGKKSRSGKKVEGSPDERRLLAANGKHDRSRLPKSIAHSAITKMHHHNLNTFLQLLYFNTRTSFRDFCLIYRDAS